MRRPIRWALALFLTALLSHAACMGRQAQAPVPERSAAASPETPETPEIEAVLREIRDRHGLPAMAAVVVRSESLQAGAVGVRRIGGSEAVTVDDLFHIGSNGKSMTSTLAGLLVEEAALSWDLALAAAFPELRLHPDYAGVTLKQLLSHTAGLPPMTYDAEFAPVPKLTGSPTEQRRAFAAWLLERPPGFPPGKEFHYSNAGYSVAAHLIETRTGTPWEELMQRRLFRPLGLKVVFGWPTAAGAAQPVGHVRGTSGLELQDPNYQLGPALAPAGDISLSILDYGRYIQAHLRGLRGRPDLLRPETYRFLHEPVGINQGTGYALGWGVRELDGVPTHGHSGSAGTFFARLALQPSRDFAVAVVTNAGDEEAEEAVREARELLGKLERR
jgi:D-alanyl-D-alanine carboxypeptidase